MGDAQWENCGAVTLLEEFFAQDRSEEHTSELQSRE